MIWSFSDEKDDEKEVSSMETATISSSSKVSCENAKSEKQSKFILMLDQIKTMKCTYSMLKQIIYFSNTICNFTHTLGDHLQSNP